MPGSVCIGSTSPITDSPSNSRAAWRHSAMSMFCRITAKRTSRLTSGESPRGVQETRLSRHYCQIGSWKERSIRLFERLDFERLAHVRFTIVLGVLRSCQTRGQADACSKVTMRFPSRLKPVAEAALAGRSASHRRAGHLLAEIIPLNSCAPLVIQDVPLVVQRRASSFCQGSREVSRSSDASTGPDRSGDRPGSGGLSPCSL